MKVINKIAIGIVTVLGLGVAAATVHAQQGPMGPGMMGGRMMGMMGSGMMGGGGPGMMGGRMMAFNQSNQQLMTPEERIALQDKMSKATTIEERQKIAVANRTEMEKRAKEKGITLPLQHSPLGGYGPSCG